MKTKRSIKIRKQILHDVLHHPTGIAAHIAEIFSISRQAVNRHLKELVDQQWLNATGTTRNKTYSLGTRRDAQVVITLDGTVSESDVFFKHFSSTVDGCKKNISDIVFYGFTEIVNNAIDHSQAKSCLISIQRDVKNITITIYDNGEGIFTRITRFKKLSDERLAILELSKGKLTTDPKNHSGQGIFFTSRMFDKFIIASNRLLFSHNHKNDLDVFLERDDINTDGGTFVKMSISLDSPRIDKEVFEEFSEGEDGDFAFNRTLIPVALARYGEEQLVSRSQAKRLLTRVECFTFVYLDFGGIESIGQAFADEIFRVYMLRHPEITLEYTNASINVEKMIKRALAN